VKENNMVKRDELIKFIHQTIGEDLLEKAQTIDKSANGVQIFGQDNVNKLVLGVSASLDFFKEAVKAKADFCILHHGLGLTEKHIYNSRPNMALQKRLKIIFDNDLTVAGFHFSLDSHYKIGNNALIIAKLGARQLDLNYFDKWGWVAEFDKSQDVKKLAEKCSNIFSNDIFAVYGGKQKVTRIGVVSGGGKPYGSWAMELAEKKIDLHITGDIGESGPALAKDMGFNYFACGHYATEVFAVQELGKIIKSHYKNKLEVEFIDISNTL